MAEALGAAQAFNYRETAFAVLAATGGRGVDVIPDMAGPDYGRRNVAALARRGRVVHWRRAATPISPQRCAN